MLRITVPTLQLTLEYISEEKIFGPNKIVGSFDSVNKSVGNFDFGNKSVSNLTSVNKSVGSQIKSIKSVGKIDHFPTLLSNFRGIP
jgi:hypothetical protein